jgi:hypothetical protein
MPRHFPPTSLRRKPVPDANQASPAGDMQHRHHLPRNNDPNRDLLSRHQRMKNHGIAMVGEFVGTLLFLWFAFAGAESAIVTGGAAGSSPSEVVLTSLSFGFSLLVTVWAFYRISGGLFNPAVRCIRSPLLDHHADISAPGDPRPSHNRQPPLASWPPSPSSPNAWWHSRSSPCSLYVPRAPRRQHYTRTRYHPSSGRLHRDVSHVTPRFHDIDVGRGETLRHIHGARWNWSRAFCRNDGWPPFHRRQSQPCAKFRTCCRKRQFPWVPLHILVRTDRKFRVCPSLR